MIAGVLLASGASRRFGSNKLLAPLGGRAVIRWSTEALLSNVDVTYVVVPRDSAALREALRTLDVRWVTNESAETGITSSIRAGIAALPDEVRAVVIALGDQPLIDGAVVARLAARWREGGVRAVAPAYEDGRGNPVLFDVSLCDALLALEGDRGARALLDALGNELAIVRVDAPMPVDVDTPEALGAVAAELARFARE